MNIAVAAETSFLGKGIYTVPEASRLTGVSATRIRRWLKGYYFKVNDEPRWSEPVWQGDLPEIDHSLALSFLDLLEVRFVNAFREQGVSWKKIRLAVEQSRKVFQTDHPFASQRFMTDGRSIFAEVAAEMGEPKLLDLVRSQYAFDKIVRPSFVKTLDFSRSTGQAIRWWPMGKRRRVVIDPERSFGQPVVSDEGVPTAALANSYFAEESLARVAHLFEVNPLAVRDAVAFEKRFAV